jgi:type I pantothenate kinase
VSNFLAELADGVAARLAERRPPHVVGIGGPVAVGKSTIAEELATAFIDRGRRVRIVATDCFLLTNEVLAERGLTFLKGFPESFDLGAITRFVQDVKAGERRIEIPVYSHALYDVMPDEKVVIEGADLVILEGVVTLQAPVVRLLDAGIYIHADEDTVKSWFVERFVRLTERAKGDPTSFYASFAELGETRVMELAVATWDTINGVNLRQHIEPSRRNATFVVTKAADHSIVRFAAQAERP